MKQGSNLAKTIFLIIIAGLFAGWYFYTDIDILYQQANTRVGEEIEQLRSVERQVIAPSPLRGPTEEAQARLSTSGTIAETNIRRAEHGLPALSANARLVSAAEAKINDMFNRQYFAHDSPTGEGPADLAESARYEYLMVGENLALGNYKDDSALVDAWMNSPGHRENILHTKYTEIGVAVRRGTFEGQTVWMAVQEFGRPASLCTRPSETLEAQIEENNVLLAEMEAELEQKQQELENARPKRGPAYNQKVEEYNDLVHQYNTLLESTKELIAKFNSQVNTFNTCIQ